MSVLSAEKVTRLSLGVSILDDIFPGFKVGDFAVLHGDAVFFMSFVLSVRCQMSIKRGGLNSSVVFVDGGNSFDPYIVAKIAQSYSLDSRLALERIHVSRAFTAYQLSSLILEKLEPFLRRKKAKLLIVSDISALFFDKDVPKTEAEDLFTKICTKLSEIAFNKQVVVIAGYLPKRRFKQNMFLETFLFGRSSVLVRFKRIGKGLNLILEDHPRVRSFTMDFPEDYSPLVAF